MSFTDKAAIITGAGQGIGFEIARQLALQGAAIVLNDVDEPSAITAAKKISDINAKCTAVVGDAANINIINAMVDAAVEFYGKLDIAIINAGITSFGDFFSYTPEAFNKVTQLNLGGSFFLAQAAAKQMKKQGNGGSLLFTSSVTAHQAHKNLAAYGMSKAALEMLAKHLVIELSPHQITVNAIAPGATDTERTASDANYIKTWSEITPLGRPASTEDIALAALFLVSPAARHITGQTLIIDGGWTSVSPSPY